MKEIKHLRVEHGDIDRIDKAVADGYRFISTLHSYEFELPPLMDQIHIVQTKYNHQDSCIDIVLEELRHSRLYQDAEIPFEEAQEDYKGRVYQAFYNDTVFVAFHERKGVVGFCVLVEHQWTRRACEISLIAVSKAFQREGIGSALVERCMVECKVRGVKFLKINTQGHNQAAKAFYEKLGFKRTAIAKDFHKHE